MKIPTLTALLIIVCISCNKTGPLPKTEIYNRKITGSVRLFDDLTNEQNADGMTVTIDGTFFIATTDTSGKYQFPPIPYGSYTLTFNKPGYGTYKIYNVQHVDDKDSRPHVVDVQSLGTISTTTVAGLTVTSVTDTSYMLNTTVFPAGTIYAPRYVRFFYSKDPGVSNENFTAVSDLYKVKDTMEVTKIRKSELIDMGFKPGETIYIKAYGDAFFSNDYKCIEKNNAVFPNINLVTVAAQSFVLQ